MVKRRISSEQLLEMPNHDAVISTALMTKQAHFLLSGYVNQQNYRCWAYTSSQELYYRPFHSDKLTGVGSQLFWSLAITVISERCVEKLRNFCEPESRLEF
jgi:hypothetical protein